MADELNPWAAPDAPLTGRADGGIAPPAPPRPPAVSLCYLMAFASPGCLLFTLMFAGAGLNIDAGAWQVLLISGLVLAWVVGAVVTFFGFLCIPSMRGWPWAWYLGLVLIGLSLTTFCNWPIGLKLAFDWFRPETRAYFRAVRRGPPPEPSPH